MICAQSVFLVLLLFTSSTFAQIPPRARSCCGLMNGKIYCYGGDMFRPNTNPVLSSGLNMLDLTNKNGTNATDLENMWQPVSYNINKTDLTNREDAQCVILEGGKQMLINGGYETTSPGQLPDLNIAYNADTNQWNALPDYTEPPYGKRQIYRGSAVNIPGQGVAFYGGHEIYINASWSIPSPGNLSVFILKDRPIIRTIGYSQVAIFQPNNSATPWKTLVPLRDGWLANELYWGQVSVFDPVSNEIVFLGGGYYKNNPPDPTWIPRPFDDIPVVNVNTSQWRNLNPKGDVPFSNRVHATATLLPRTNRHILLFGGESSDGTVCLEYCFTLNLETNTWKKQYISASPGSILQRSRHSAVLVDNGTLFIMGGVDANRAGVSSILILNVSDPDSIVLSSQYIDLNAPDANQEAQGNTETNDNGGGHTDISTGAKAGIAVACVVVAILGLISTLFCLRNRKNKKTIRNRQRELTAQQQYQEEQEDAIPMEVDWDRIENKYTEMPPIYALQSHANRVDDDHRMGSPTTFNTETLVNTIEPTSFHAVPPDGVEPQNPHAMDSNSNDVQSLHPMNRTNKPDGVICSNRTGI